MSDDLNIRQLYENILERRVKANGHVILENVSIPSKNSNPDNISFDGKRFSYEGGYAFSFIGEKGLVLYTDMTHIYIFNSLKYIKNQPKKLKKILKEYNVEMDGELTSKDLSYFFDNQKKESLGKTRIATQSGRIWKSVPSQTAKKNVSVIAFWCKQEDVTDEHIKKLKAYFDVKDVYWVASDSKNYNYHGDTYTTGDVKELRSKIAPELSHEDIVDILMRRHTGYRLTPFEKKIAWEFSGFDPSEVKQITGGYPSVAEYEYRKKLSENHEK